MGLPIRASSALTSPYCSAVFSSGSSNVEILRNLRT
jgi:hypothetical protein